GLFQTSVRQDERNGTRKSGNPYHLPPTLPIASPAGIHPPYLSAARFAMSVTSTSESLKSAGRPFAKCATRSCPDFAATSAANRAGRSACGMRSIVTLTPLVSPHFFAHPSRYVSKSGTKWLHWRMLRLPLSFGRAPIDAAALGAALTPPPGPGLCCPMHAASMGAVAAAAAPFSRVRRLTRLLACSFFTSTSCALLGIYTAQRRVVEQAFRATQAISRRRRPLARVYAQERGRVTGRELAELAARVRVGDRHGAVVRHRVEAT